MKMGLPHVERLTNEEKKVIEWAFNLAHSVVAGDYKLPKPMNYAINNLQDAVNELAEKRGITIEDGCSQEYLGFHKGYWEGVEDKLKERQGNDYKT